jgi:pimeloyl-ACP methyl ester carboxylesterase
MTDDEMNTLGRAPTRYIAASGTTFAYRRIGSPDGIPLVFLQHFSGHMDSWDPAIVDRLARTRPVVVFDNAGVGRSSGRTPESVLEMSIAATAFVRALGLSKVDLLGYSLGGMIAQQVAVDEPTLVRKLLLVSTAPRGGDEHLLAVLQEAGTHHDAPDPRLPLFFTQSATSQRAGLAFLARAGARSEDRDPDSGDDVMQPQARALIGWCASKDEAHSMLRAIGQPTLIVCGSDDTMLPAENSYRMFKAMPNAQLVLYPDAGHGALFQYPDVFSAQVELVLSDGYVGAGPGGQPGDPAPTTTQQRTP